MFYLTVLFVLQVFPDVPDNAQLRKDSDINLMKVLESLAPVTAEEDVAAFPSNNNFERARREVQGSTASGDTTTANATKPAEESQSTSADATAASMQADGPALSSVEGNEPYDVPHPLTPQYTPQPPPPPAAAPPQPPPAPPVIVSTKITPLPAMIHYNNNSAVVDGRFSKPPTDNQLKLTQDIIGSGEGSGQTFKNSGLSADEASFISALHNNNEAKSEIVNTPVLPGSEGAIEDESLGASGSGSGEQVVTNDSDELGSGTESVASGDKRSEIEVESTSGSNFLSGDDSESSGDSEDSLPGSLGAFKGIEKIEKKEEEEKDITASGAPTPAEDKEAAEPQAPAAPAAESPPAPAQEDKPAPVEVEQAAEAQAPSAPAAETPPAPAQEDKPEPAIPVPAKAPVTSEATEQANQAPAAEPQAADTVETQTSQPEKPEKVESAAVQQPQEAQITVQAPQKSAAVDQEEDLMSSGSGTSEGQRVTYESFPELQTETGSGTEGSATGHETQHTVPYHDPNYIKEEQPEPRHPTAAATQAIETQDTPSASDSESGSGSDVPFIADSEEQLPGSVGAMGPNLMTMNNLAGSGDSSAESSGSGSGAGETVTTTAYKKDNIEESPDLRDTIESDSEAPGSGGNMDDDLQSSEASGEEVVASDDTTGTKVVSDNDFDGGKSTITSSKETIEGSGSATVESSGQQTNINPTVSTGAATKDTVLTAKTATEDSAKQAKPLPESLGVEESISFSGSGVSQGSASLDNNIAEETVGEGSADDNDQQLQQFKKNNLQDTYAKDDITNGGSEIQTNGGSEIQAAHAEEPAVSLKLPSFDLSKDSSLKAALGQAAINNAPLTIDSGSFGSGAEPEGSTALEGSGITGTLEFTPVTATEEAVQQQNDSPSEESSSSGESKDGSTSGAIEEEQPEVEVETEQEEV